MNTKKLGVLAAVVAGFVVFAAAAFAQEMNKAPQHAGTPAPEGSFKFAVISDLHGDQRPGTTVFKEAVQELNLLDPDFVICVGDLIRGYGDPKDEPALKKKINGMWDELDAEIAKLKRPFYYVFGNHDASNAAQIRIIRERYGAPYYSFNHKGAHFIVLMTEVFDEGGKASGINSDVEQIAWLKKDLDASKDATHTFVFFHKPWLPPDIMDLFKGRATSVFAGHWHTYTQFVKDGINYHVLSSTGGGTFADFYGGGFYQYAVVTVTGREAVAAMVRVGAVIPDDLLSESRLKNTWAAREALQKIFCKIPRVGLVLDQPLDVRVTNPLTVPAKGFLAWTVPPGSLWKVTPERQEVVLAPGGEIVLSFKVSCYASPLALPESMLPKFQLRVLGGRALDAYSPAVAGLDPLYNIEGTLRPDPWPYAASVAAFAKSVALPKMTFAEKFRQTCTLTVKNPFDRDMAATLVWQTSNPKWSIKPLLGGLRLPPGGSAPVTFEFAYDGKADDAFPMPRLEVKATCDAQVVYDELLPMSVDTSDVLRTVSRQVTCPALKSKPTLDGRLDDAAWKDAAIADGFILLDGTGEPLQPTTVRVGSTAEGLWVAFRCREPARAHVQAKFKDHDSEIWEDDSCEIFIDAKFDRKTYFQFVFNTLGAQYEGKEKDGSWNGAWQVKTAWEDGAWTAEAFIPWDTLGGRPAPGAKWGFNLLRGRVGTYGDFEVSQWCPTFGSAHAPARFGTVVFR